MKKYLIYTLAGICAFSFANTFALNTITATIDDQTNITLTIYNNNLALIKDTRNISLPSGRSRLILEDVSANIRPETASLNALDDKNPVTLIEQNFDYDLLTPNKLLEKYVGRNIKIVKTNPVSGIETILNATVLSAYNGVVLKVGNHLETGMPEHIQFPDLPNNLRSKPTLIIDLEQQQTSRQTFELSYLSTGLSWKADYVARINSTETKLDLNAWVTLTNQSGAVYKNAQLQLVAGDVNQVRNIRLNKASLERARDSLASTSQVSEESLLDYHLYSLNNKTDILDNQTKQVALFSRTQIPITKTYRINGSSYYYDDKYAMIDKQSNAHIFLSFTNNETSNLSLPLPKGIVRSYKNDSTNNLQFIGEDQINHTAKNETVTLNLGKAFDIIASKKQNNFKIKSKGSNAELITEAEYEITVKNAKDSIVTVLIEEPIPGDWEIINETHTHQKIDSSTAQWTLSVPANNQSTLVFSVKIKH